MISYTLVWFSGICKPNQELTKRNEMATEERWVGAEDVSAHVGVNKDSIYRWIEKKGLPAHRVGRLFRFKLSEVDEWVRAGGASESSNLSTMAKKIDEENSAGAGPSAKSATARDKSHSGRSIPGIHCHIAARSLRLEHSCQTRRLFCPTGTPGCLSARTSSMYVVKTCWGKHPDLGLRISWRSSDKDILSKTSLLGPYHTLSGINATEIPLQQILYFHAVRSDSLLRDVVADLLVPQWSRGAVAIDVREIHLALRKWVEEGKTSGAWSNDTVRRVPEAYSQHFAISESLRERSINASLQPTCPFKPLPTSHFT